MSEYLIIANWKMNKTADEAVADAKSIKELFSSSFLTSGMALDSRADDAHLDHSEGQAVDETIRSSSSDSEESRRTSSAGESSAPTEAETGRVEIGIAPSMVHLLALRDVLGEGVLLFAQNGHAEDAGAFTGEVAFAQLEPVVDGVILGHSERRHVFGETDEQVQKKVLSALRKALHVVLCIGETREERDAGKSEEVVRRQLEIALQGVSDVKDLDVAYEPVWAISGGDASVEPATSEEIASMHAFIRSVLHELLRDNADAVRILYGGSVKPDNAAAVLALEDVQGALVGGASLDPESFVSIVRAIPSS